MTAETLSGSLVFAQIRREGRKEGRTEEAGAACPFVAGGHILGGGGLRILEGKRLMHIFGKNHLTVGRHTYFSAYAPVAS